MKKDSTDNGLITGRFRVLMSGLKLLIFKASSKWATMASRIQSINPPWKALSILAPSIAIASAGAYAALYPGTFGKIVAAVLGLFAVALLASFIGTGCGTVFKMTPLGQETILYKFKYQFTGHGGQDGRTPSSGLIDVGGTLYGTTVAGGAHSDGTVFAVTP